MIVYTSSSCSCSAAAPRWLLLLLDAEEENKWKWGEKSTETVQELRRKPVSGCCFYWFIYTRWRRVGGWGCSVAALLLLCRTVPKRGTTNSHTHTHTQHPSIHLHRCRCAQLPFPVAGSKERMREREGARERGRLAFFSELQRLQLLNLTYFEAHFIYGWPFCFSQHNPFGQPRKLSLCLF